MRRAFIKQVGWGLVPITSRRDGEYDYVLEYDKIEGRNEYKLRLKNHLTEPTFTLTFRVEEVDNYDYSWIEGGVDGQYNFTVSSELAYRAGQYSQGSRHTFGDFFSENCKIAESDDTDDGQNLSIPADVELGNIKFEFEEWTCDIPDFMIECVGYAITEKENATFDIQGVQAKWIIHDILHALLDYHNGWLSIGPTREKWRIIQASEIMQKLGMPIDLQYAVQCEQMFNQMRSSWKGDETLRVSEMYFKNKKYFDEEMIECERELLLSTVKR